MGRLPLAEVHVVVAGGPATGKTMLIHAAGGKDVAGASVAAPLRIPGASLPDKVDALLIDTSSALKDHTATLEACRAAHVIVLTYAVNKPASLAYLRTNLLPSLRMAHVAVPMILVGCMQDTVAQQPQSLESEIVPMMNDFREIETWLECSAQTNSQVQEVVFYAQRAVLHPTAPMFDTHTQQLMPRCVAALRRIFHLCDTDQDGALSDAELNAFQVKCFNTPLLPEEIAGVKKVVSEKLPAGVAPGVGLTLTGFLFLHALFIERGRIETTWTVLRRFGYSNELTLEGAPPGSLDRHPDQVVELSPAVRTMLTALFHAHDTDKDGALSAMELQELLSTAPYSPWEAPQWKASAETVGGGLTLKGFMARWALKAMLEPEDTFTFLQYLGFQGDVHAALHISKRRAVERAKGHVARTTLKVLVLGAPQSGKSAALDHFIGLPFRKTPALVQPDKRFTAKEVELEGRPVTLTLHEPSPKEMEGVLVDSAELARADVALFVYDCTSPASFEFTSRQLHRLAEMDCGVPCVLVAAKHDLAALPEVQEAVSVLAAQVPAVCEELAIPVPLPLSLKVGDGSVVYEKLLAAIVRPASYVPETPRMRTAKANHAAVTKAYTYIALSAAVGVVAVLVYRWGRIRSG